MAMSTVGSREVENRLAMLERKVGGGDGSAACILGDHFRLGDIVTQDLPAAFRWYSRGADLGDSDSQNNLGTMLLHGLGTEIDVKRAVHWYGKSAEQGNADAQYNLGKRYLHGRGGIRRNYAKAHEWFRRAAVQGDPLAISELGTMHWLGHGVPKNILAAADFHIAAANAGDNLASRNLGEYKSELEAAALSGSQIASLFLCRMHNRGFGVERSQAMTWAWIAWAHQRCTPDPDHEIVEEVAEAYNFYRMAIPSRTRRAGDKAFAQVVAAAGRGTA
jgi:TPR repeat protein